ncbi:MAG TPA: hypothetical protein VLE03_08645, partial [Nitrospiraceae bacterium]|nr:hypothetical protein [Nitrospiraceae bacterium]
VLTTDGRLGQVWDTDRWNLDFPADLSVSCGKSKKFVGNQAAFPVSPEKKWILLLTDTGRLMQLWDTDVWNSVYPTELGGF